MILGVLLGARWCPSHFFLEGVARLSQEYPEWTPLDLEERSCADGKSHATRMVGYLVFSWDRTIACMRLYKHVLQEKNQPSVSGKGAAQIVRLALFHCGACVVFLSRCVGYLPSSFAPHNTYIIWASN